MAPACSIVQPRTKTPNLSHNHNLMSNTIRMWMRSRWSHENQSHSEETRVFRYMGSCLTWIWLNHIPGVNDTCRIRLWLIRKRVKQCYGSILRIDFDQRTVFYTYWFVNWKRIMGRKKCTVGGVLSLCNALDVGMSATTDCYL